MSVGSVGVCARIYLHGTLQVWCVSFVTLVLRFGALAWVQQKPKPPAAFPRFGLSLYVCVFLFLACREQALGCVLYAVCYLKNPFQDAGNLGILNAK